MTPRGIRNHNPGNIDHNPANRWQGLADPPIEQGVPQPRFARFIAPEWGIRAIARLLITYQERHQLHTLQQLIHRWAPPNENKTASYVYAVARTLRVAPDAPIDVQSYAVMRPLVEAIIRHENGQQPYSPAVIDHGLLLAGIQPPKRPVLATKTGTGAVVTTAGVALEATAPALTEAGVQLQSTGLPWVQIIAAALTVAGVALVLWGRLSVQQRTGV